MTPEQLKMNKDAAESLGWSKMYQYSYSDRMGQEQGPLLGYSDNNHTTHKVEDMHFHDSYDWVALLISKCDHLELHKVIGDRLSSDNFQVSSMNILSWWVRSAPKQKCEVCLEVLGG